MQYWSQIDILHSWWVINITEQQRDCQLVQMLTSQRMYFAETQKQSP